MSVTRLKIVCGGSRDTSRVAQSFLGIGQRNDFSQLCAFRGYADKQHQLRAYSTAKIEVKRPPIPSGELIYEGKFSSTIKRVKLFSLATSSMGLAAQPILFQKGVELSGYGLGTTLCGIASIFTFVTPCLLHFVTRKYVVEMRHDPESDEYAATTVSFFLMRNNVCFPLPIISRERS